MTEKLVEYFHSLIEKDLLYKEINNYLDVIVIHLISMRVEIFKEDQTDIRNEPEDIVDTSKFLEESSYGDILNKCIWDVINHKFKQQIQQIEELKNDDQI